MLAEAAKYYLDIHNKLGREENLVVTFKLGYMYENGLGVRNDPAQAMIYYTQAANQGLIEAQQNLKILQQKTGSFTPH